MPQYQLYYMNPVSGHIDRQETLHAGDDVSAVHMLQGMDASVPLELWRDGLKVARQDGPANAIRERWLAAVEETGTSDAGAEADPGDRAGFRAERTDCLGGPTWAG